MGHRLYIRKEKKYLKAYGAWNESLHGWCTCENWNYDQTLINRDYRWYDEERGRFWVTNQFNHHKQWEDNANTPMELVGVVHMKTVDQEYWLVHANGEIPEFYPRRDPWAYNRDTWVTPKVFGQGWTLVQKNSKGYRPWGRMTSFNKERVRLEGQLYVMSVAERDLRYTYELAQDLPDIKSIKYPPMPLERYIKSLVAESQEIEDVQDIKKLQDQFDRILALNDVVQSARSEMIARVLSI